MEAKNIKIAYLLLVHNKPEQLNMFVTQVLNYGDCDVYIHVDRKNKEMVDKILNDSRVRVISKYEVSWASFSMMEATIELMREVIKRGKNYTHIYYGSGDDLLVKNGLYEYLADHSQSVFMDLYWGGIQITDRMRTSARYKIAWPQCLKTRKDYYPARYIRIMIQILCTYGIVFFKNKNSIDHLKLRIYCGSQWFVVPFEVILYFLEYLNMHPEYIEYWRNALAPDEMFFHTLIMNSEYRKYIRPSLMFRKEGKTFGTKNHPMLITEQYINEIENGEYYCARKFDFKKNPNVFHFFLRTSKDGYNK